MTSPHRRAVAEAARHPRQLLNAAPRISPDGMMTDESWNHQPIISCTHTAAQESICAEVETLTQHRREMIGTTVATL